MTERKKFDHLAHISKKYRNKERIPISLQLYDLVLPHITFALRNSIYSQENNTGVKALILFGSWSRRSDITGPTLYSDIELLAYKQGYLEPDEQDEMKKIVKKHIREIHLYKNFGIRPNYITVWSGIDSNDLLEIYQGTDPYTQDGFIFIS